MSKVKDITGKEIPGLYRAQNGTLFVHDKRAYEKYIQEKNIRLKTESKIQSLESEILELKSMIKSLLENKSV